MKSFNKLEKIDWISKHSICVVIFFRRDIETFI